MAITSDSTLRHRAERAALGVAIYFPAKRPQVMRELASEVWTTPRHKIVWRAIVAVGKETPKWDLLYLMNFLDRHEWLEKLGGESYFVNLIDDLPRDIERVMSAGFMEQVALPV